MSSAAAPGRIRRVAESGDILAESPVWDPRTRQLAWIDAAESSALNTLEWSTLVHRRVALSARCTAIGLTDTPGEYVGAFGDGAGIVDGSGEVLSLVPLGPSSTGTVTNDGACDPSGTFGLGTTTDARVPGAGSLYRFDGESVHHVSDGYTLSNGIAWTPDGAGFYHVDTLDRVVRWSLWDDRLRELRQTDFLTFAESDGLPDGIALDAEGGLWIAFWGAGEVRCYAETGRLVQTVSVPVPNVTAVAFGGPALETLFISTARSTPDPKEPDGSGDLYACDVGVAGAEPLVYTGKR